MTDDALDYIELQCRILYVTATPIVASIYENTTRSYSLHAAKHLFIIDRLCCIYIIIIKTSMYHLRGNLDII